MKNPFLIFLLFIVILEIPNFSIKRSINTAKLDFERAKYFFQQQEFTKCIYYSNLSRLQDPRSPSPWILSGNCFYLQGHNEQARFNYSQALKLNPSSKHMPPFLKDFMKDALKPFIPFSAISPQKLHQLQLEIGQMLMIIVPGTQLSQEKEKTLNNGWAGGIILFDQNIESKKQIKQYIQKIQSDSKIPLFIALDQEGGEVRRLRRAQGFQYLPSLKALGKTNNLALAYTFGQLSGHQLKEIGANMNLAPVVDLNHHLPNCAINQWRRSLGSNPIQVAHMAEQIILGMKSEGILATAKHFPSESVASENPIKHIAVSSVSMDQLIHEDLYPYQFLIKRKLLDAIMISEVIYKNVDPYFPAALSSRIIQNLLRKKLGFRGITISDDLQMNAIRKHYSLSASTIQAVNAGIDLLLITDNVEIQMLNILTEAVLQGKISINTIKKADRHLLQMKLNYGIVSKQQLKQHHLLHLLNQSLLKIHKN
jgi:beta-N-acetylhexosaminidase